MDAGITEIGFKRFLSLDVVDGADCNRREYGFRSAQISLKLGFCHDLDSLYLAEAKNVDLKILSFSNHLVVFVSLPHPHLWATADFPTNDSRV